MVAIDISTALGSFLPKTLTLPTGTLSLEWHDATEDFDRPSMTYGTFRLQGAPMNPRHQGLDSDYVAATESATDVIAYVTGTTDYQVSERDIVTVTSLTGTRSGGAYTFVLNTDFEIVSTDDYTTKNAIRWKSGGAKPDNGTNFTVNYTHRVYDEQVRNYLEYTYRLSVHVNDATVGGTFIPKGRLSQMVWEAVLSYVSARRGKNLSGTGVLKLKVVQPIGLLPTRDQDDFVVLVLDIVLKRALDETVQRVKVVGKTVTNFTAT